jgi:hypothetical protein
MEDTITAENSAGTFRLYLAQIEEEAYVVRNVSTSKEEALNYECPKCRTAPGDRCTEEDGVTWRKSLHQERHAAACEGGARVRFIGGVRVHYADAA